tara:strand:- start:1623 stop:1772 length:150 start_codon:yes stop_codon:yes gene_type:complete
VQIEIKFERKRWTAMVMVDGMVVVVTDEDEERFRQQEGEEEGEEGEEIG